MGASCQSCKSAFADQFFARDYWISAKLRIDQLLGQKESNGVYLCQDNYLIEIPEAPDQAVLGRTLTAMKNFAVQHDDLRMTAMIVPNASLRHARLPAKNAPAHNQQEDLFAVNQTLSPCMQYADVTQALKAHVKDGVFYRTDHHWTSLGAYCAFDASAELLGIEMPITNYRVHVLTNSFEGTLASKSGKHTAEDTITAYEPLGTDVSYYVLYDSTQEKAGSVFVDSALDTKDKYTVFFGGNHPLVTIKTTANNGKILLIFKDSYANSFVPFLIPYYQQIVMIDPRYYYDDVEQLMTQRGVTDVLFLYNLSTFLRRYRACGYAGCVELTRGISAWISPKAAQTASRPPFLQGVYRKNRHDLGHACFFRRNSPAQTLRLCCYRSVSVTMRAICSAPSFGSCVSCAESILSAARAS